MPIYEYQCTACKHQLDVLQKITDIPLKECPECHGDTLQKLVSKAGFQLKGTGWYVTDFKNKESKKDTNEQAKINNNQDTTTKSSDSKPSDSGKPTTSTDSTANS